MCVAHSTYRGIDNSSKPMNSTTRSFAATSTNMPRIDVSISAKYSPSPASAAATERHDRNTAAMPPARNTSVRDSVRSSITSADATIASFVSHCQIASPAVTPSATSVSTGTKPRRTNTERPSPASRTTQIPDRQRDRRRERGPIDVRTLDRHRFTAATVVLTASCPASSASCGYSAKARIASTSGTSTNPSRSESSNEATFGPTRLCIERMYMRSA